MKTIICDIDGTLTNMWPVEKAVLAELLGKNFEQEIENLKALGMSETYKIFLNITKKKIGKKEYVTLYNNIFLRLKSEKLLPKMQRYSLADWIVRNKLKYNFVYATGGQKDESEFVLENLGLLKYFDLKNSVDKSGCKYSKITGIPPKRIKRKFPDCVFVGDSNSDWVGAEIAQIPFVQVNKQSKVWLENLEMLLKG